MFRNWNSYTIGQEKEGTKSVPPTTLSAQMPKKQLPPPRLFTREQKMSNPTEMEIEREALTLHFYK